MFVREGGAFLDVGFSAAEMETSILPVRFLKKESLGIAKISGEEVVD
jgi:hypothetical protein